MIERQILRFNSAPVHKKPLNTTASELTPVMTYRKSARAVEEPNLGASALSTLAFQLPLKGRVPCKTQRD